MSNIDIIHLPALRVTNCVDDVEIELEPIDANVSFLYIATDGDKGQQIVITDDALDGLVAAIEVFKAKRKYYRF